MGTSKRFLAKNGLDNNNQTLANVANPVNAQDAATKSFSQNVDNHVSGTNNKVFSAADKSKLDGALAASSYTAADVLTKVKTVDGTGSGLDADLLDGLDSSAFALAGHNHTLTIGNGTATQISVGTNERLDVVAGTNVSVAYDDVNNKLTISTTGTLSGNADTATKLATSRTIATSGDVTGTATSFDGSANISIATTLANSGVVAGTYPKVTVDAKGRVTTGASLATADIPNLDAAKITTGTLTVGTSGNAGTATTLATARTINGVSFDGSTNITINAVDATARVASSLLGVANGVATLDASGLVPSTQLPSYVDDVLEYANLAAFPATGTTGKIFVTLDTNKTYRWSGSAYVEISASPGSTDAVTEGTTNLYFTAARAQAAVTTITGNAATATKLATARTINGVSFDGTANITVNAVDATARIASTEKAAANGVATLDATTKIPVAQIPSLPASIITSGTLATAQLPALTGDITSTAGSATTTLANSGVTAGTFNNSATAVTPYTVDAKGRITGTGAAVTITPAWSSITGKPTSISGYGISMTTSDVTNALGYTPAKGNGAIGNADLNTIVNSGMYRFDQPTANGPGHLFGQLLVIRGASDTITQLTGDYASGSLYTRSGNSSDVGGTGTWQPWRKILDLVNFNNHVPTLAGVGATGTWSINVSGNAATATNATNATIAARVTLNANEW